MEANKEKLRKDLRQRRQLFVKTASLEDVLQGLYHNLFSLNFFKAPLIIGGYYSQGAEVSVLPLLTSFYYQGHTVVLPIIEKIKDYMEFRKWTPSCEMGMDACGVLAPLSSKTYMPEVLLVPLLGFDEQGRRLGQGKGCYDSFIEISKKTSSFKTVGIAYEMQKIAFVPTEVHDQTLDYIVTEKKVYRFH